MKRQDKKLVYVAMSGGVDSSVAAALLKKHGFSVVGVFMKPWSPNLSTTTPGVVNKVFVDKCMWKEDREDAMRVASALGIPFKTWDFSREYKKSVTDYMVREYKAGRTPNPDVMCNKEIKFGLFFNRAIKEGADFIATGHYVRIKRKSQTTNHKSQINPKLKNKFENLNIENSLEIVNCKLKIAKDKNKDQSYFLWTLTQKQLKYCLFPIGDYIKPEIRKMAKKFGLPNHDKKDSQGVCFIGPLDMKDFLKTKIKPKKGKIISLRLNLKEIIGEHDGACYYTIGQRHGLNLSIGGGPYYVVSKDVKKNIIYVGDEKDLYSKILKISDISWINPTWKLNFQVKKAMGVDVRVRYRAGLKKAILKKNGELWLKTPERAITSGQSAVFYRNGELLGGGIIR